VADIDWAQDSRTALADTIKEALDAGDAEKVQQHVVQGHPAQVLADAAADADLLVVGSRGHGGFAGMLLGSVSHHVIAHARCPVVVIHGHEKK
jgi:nucleotide-binding universal stress UspA family protein